MGVFSLSSVSTRSPISRSVKAAWDRHCTEEVLKLLGGENSLGGPDDVIETLIAGFSSERPARCEVGDAQGSVLQPRLEVQLHPDVGIDPEHGDRGRRDVEVAHVEDLLAFDHHALR